MPDVKRIVELNQTSAPQGATIDSLFMPRKPLYFRQGTAATRMAHPASRPRRSGIQIVRLADTLLRTWMQHRLSRRPVRHRAWRGWRSQPGEPGGGETGLVTQVNAPRRSGIQFVREADTS